MYNIVHTSAAGVNGRHNKLKKLNMLTIQLLVNVENVYTL
jgi:hypothetical protein